MRSIITAILCSSTILACSGTAQAVLSPPLLQPQISTQVQPVGCFARRRYYTSVNHCLQLHGGTANGVTYCRLICSK